MARREEQPIDYVVLLRNAGLILVGVAVVWWYAYYAQHGGTQADWLAKLGCLSKPTPECVPFEQAIGPDSRIPKYRPELLWGAFAILVVTFLLLRRRG